MTEPSLATADEPRAKGDRLRRALRLAPVVVPLLLVVPALWPELRIAWLAVHEPFGRDQGIFQYISFALTKGQRDYADFHEINGPLVHLLQLVLYWIGGENELVIRAVDFAATAVVFFGAGAVIPGIGWAKGDAPNRPPFSSRILWGLAGSVALWGNLLRYNWWDHTQRESFYDLFIVAALAIQLYAHIPSRLSDRRRLLLFGVAGALSLLPSFGKPTCGLYFLGQIAGLWLDGEAPLDRRRRLRAFLLGAAAGCIPVAIFVAIYADPAAMVRDVLLDGPRIYRHIWHKSFAEGYFAWGNAPRLNYGVFTALALVPLAWVGLLPRRVWPAAFFLVGGIINFFLQGKMFPYHLHPITCGAFLIWVWTLGVLVERAPLGRVRRTPPAVGLGLAAFVAAFLSWQCIEEATLSQTAREMTPDRMAVTHTLYDREHKLPKFYNGGDYYPWDLRRAGWFIRDVTAPSERVQVWGMDPYVLFFAQRLSATPFLYSFEINVDAAIAGGSGGKPSPSQAAWIRAKGAANAKELDEAVRAHPPAAFVMIDNQPFSYPQDADEDFHTHCPATWSFLVDRYTRVRRFGHVRVWLRKDLASKVAPPADPADAG